MEKKELLDNIEAFITEFPEMSAAFEQVMNDHKALRYRQKLAATDKKTIMFLWRKEVTPNASLVAKEKIALTLKKMCETPEGCSGNLPHLKGLHVMTISTHFSKLCAKGFVERISKGHFKLTPKAWQFMERANGLQDAYNELYDLM
jgi:hypothetical protein